MNDIVIIAGSIWQQPLVEYMKKFYRVHVVNPVKTDTTCLADNHIKRDIYDLKGILRDLKNISPLFVVTDQSDAAVLPATNLANELGLPSNGDSVKYFCDKAKCSELAKSLEIPHIVSIEVKTLEKAYEAAERLGFPFVMKPVDSSASKGVYKVNSADEIPSFFKRSIQRSRKRTLLFQELVGGELQVVVEGFCSNGVHHSVSCGIIHRSWTDQKVPLLPFILWSYNPPPDLMKANNKFVERSGLHFGITHAEYFLDGDEFKLVEIGCRGGGFKISSDIVPWVSGVNLYDSLHLSMLGKEVNVNTCDSKYALLQFFQKEEHPISSVGNILECKSHVAQDFHKNPDNLRYSYLIALAETKSQLSDIIIDIGNKSSCRTLPSLDLLN